MAVLRGLTERSSGSDGLRRDIGCHAGLRWSAFVGRRLDFRRGRRSAANPTFHTARCHANHDLRRFCMKKLNIISGAST